MAGPKAKARIKAAARSQEKAAEDIFPAVNLWSEEARNSLFQGLDKDLLERNTRYGTFKDNSEVAQILKEALRGGANWDQLHYSQKEALELIAVKMGRLVSGNCGKQQDSWYDIAGYAKLGSGNFD